MSTVVACNQSDKPFAANEEPVPSVADSVKNQDVPAGNEEIPPQVKNDDADKDEGAPKGDGENQSDDQKIDPAGGEQALLYHGFELQPSFPPSVYKAMQDLISDDDGDGVINMNDKCAGTEKGWVVDKKGCALVLNLVVKPELNYYGGFYKDDSVGVSDAPAEPKVIAFSPPNGADGKEHVTACHPITTFTYDSDMDAASFAGKVKIFSTTAKEQKVGFEVKDATITIQSLEPLLKNTDYFVEIYSGVKSKSGGVTKESVGNTIHTNGDSCN